MQHDLNDQWRALAADLEAARNAAEQARAALNQRIAAARTGAKDLKPLPQYLAANDAAGEGVAKAERAMARFRKLHPEIR